MTGLLGGPTSGQARHSVAGIDEFGLKARIGGVLNRWPAVGLAVVWSATTPRVLLRARAGRHCVEPADHRGHGLSDRLHHQDFHGDHGDGEAREHGYVQPHSRQEFSRTRAVQTLVLDQGVRRLVTAVPVVVPLGMRVLFPVLARRLGTRRGHLMGFAVYWAVCYLLPLGLLGRARAGALLRAPARPLPSPRWLAAAALLLPPLGAIGAELAPELSNTDPTLMATATSVAIVNAAGEELLWRGLFVATFPNDPVRGWLWPAVGFIAWHLAPQAVLPSRRGSLAFLGPTALIGAGLGWVAWRTGSLRWTLPSHVATDASGLRVARFWLGRRP